MDKKIDLKHLNVKAFARDAMSAQGHQSLAYFERLSDLARSGDEQDSQAPQVSWSLTGEMVPVTGGDAEIWLHLAAEVSLPMQCQRCMGPVLVAVFSDQSFRFVADEATAEAQDDESEEDLLVLSPELDVWELIEDELIMSAPIVPKHEVCPATVTMSVADAAFEEALEAKPNPFAALAQLKQKPQ
ncbi:MAG: hypothetical protein RL462_1580 [Pseudomonadota bacterium]|jgi:uncharacterized protein